MYATSSLRTALALRDDSVIAGIGPGDMLSSSLETILRGTLGILLGIPSWIPPSRQTIPTTF